MTLNEAYRILRRYQDCLDGFDFRPHDRAGLALIGEAINFILQSNGLGEPLIDCFRCRNFHQLSGLSYCEANQIGECRRFEPEDEP